MSRGLALAALVALSAAPAAARTLRWAKDGSGDAKTLDALLERARPGDTVELVDNGFFGAEIRKLGGFVYIERPLPGGGAEAAGLKQGDRLSAIDDQPVDGVSIDDATALLRGRAGKTVRVVLARGNEAPRTVEVLRRPSTIAVKGDEDKARAAFTARQSALAVSYEEKAAQAGSLEAMKILANCYRGHYGVARHDRKALRWIKTLAEKGDAKAQGALGHIYLKGEGAAKDLKQFVHWTELSASNGDGYGQYLLGWANQNGVGLRVDRAAAATWYEKAAAQRQPGAAQALAALRSGKNLFVKAQPVAPAPLAAAQPDAAEAASAGPAAAAGKPSDVDKPSYSKKARPDDVAVVIGVDKYASLPPASYAERDAAAVRAHLVALGFPDRNVFSLIGPRATKSAFIKELETRLSRVAKPDSTVFVYYSGHGAPDPKNGDAYLVPYDGDPEFLEDTAYPLKRLYAKLGELKAKRVIVALDSCFSGVGGRSVLAKGVRPLVTKSTPAPADGGKVVALTAASGSEISGALDEQSHGLFTYYLLKGLNQGKTSLGELESFIKPQVEDEARRHNRDQTPQLAGADAAATELAP